MPKFTQIVENIKYNDDGLVPVIAQQYDSKDVLMLAWMNQDALLETLTTRKLCYFSRSRRTLWRKGESSGQTQSLKELIVDCDNDTILALVDQKGVACHTGRPNCFFKTVTNGKEVINQDIIVSPLDLYTNDA